MLCITGSYVAKKEMILVSFDDDVNGIIAIHTYTKEISIPFGAFSETDFELFKSSMNCIIKGSEKLKYNTC